MDATVEEGCRDALAGVVEVQRHIDKLNRVLRDELKHELEVGIGIHCGEVIVGKMGPPRTPIISAIGTNVNIAARLETLTKKLGCGVAVSSNVLERAGQSTGPFEIREVSLDGLTYKITVFTLPKDFGSALSATQIQALTGDDR